MVYMHRWNQNCIGRVLVYLHKIQEKYENEVRAIDAMLEHMTDKRQQAAEEKRRDHLLKQIAEIKNMMSVWIIWQMNMSILIWMMVLK